MGRNPTVPERYTIVQHSGFGYGYDPGFERGLEVRSVTTKAEQDRVKKEGGVLFDSYVEADEFTESAMYPEGHDGIYPNAQGRFSEKMIDDLRIYIPLRKAVG